MARLRQLDPGSRASNPREALPIGQADDFLRFAEAMRNAGLPEARDTSSAIDVSPCAAKLTINANA
jgi:hypothetical protein